MTDSKWTIVPPTRKSEALKEGVKEGGLILIIGIILYLFGLRVVSVILIVAGLFLLVLSPFLFRQAIIKGYCPVCNRFISIDFKDQIACPFCKHKIDINNIDTK